MQLALWPDASVARLVVFICTFHLCACDNWRNDWHFKGENIAYEKTATQGPDTYHDGPKYYTADFAVDGNTSGKFADGSCTHTKGNSSVGAFWTVDLKKAYAITGVIIYNRDDVRIRLKNFILFGNGSVVIHNSKGRNEYTQQVLHFKLDGKRSFSSITVNLPAHHGHPESGQYYLTLCEVEIYAAKVPSCAIDNISNGYLEIFNNTGETELGKYSLGTVIFVRCNGTFILVGEASAKCLDTGFFSPYPLGKCIDACQGIRNLEHGQVNPSNDMYHVDQPVYITCDFGYEASNSVTTIYCLSGGEWYPSIPTCNLVKCQHPGNLTGGYYVVSNSDTSTISWTELPFRTVITGLCYSGYETSSIQSMTCQSNKMWSGMKTVCTPIVCQRPTIITNGYYSFRNGTKIDRNDINPFVTFQYQTVIIVSCIKGYVLTSPTARTCEGSKKWSGEEPVCNVITCNFPEKFQNGNYAKHSTFSDENKSSIPYLTGPFNYSEKVTVFCDRGYRLTSSANKTRECNSEGYWTGVNPVCSLVTCKWPLIIDNGRYVVSNNLTSDRMPYNTTTTTITCDDTFELVDSAGTTRRCNEEGTWDGEPASCMRRASNYTGIAVGITSVVVVVLILIVLTFVFYRRRIVIKANAKSDNTENRRKGHKNSDLTNTAVYEYADIHETGFNFRNTRQGNSNQFGIYSNVSTEKHVMPLVESSSSLQNDHAYYSFEENEKIPSTAIKLKDLAELVLTGADVKEKLRKQFESLPQGMVGPHKEALKPQNRGKNRYKKLYAYDDTRVILDVEDDTESNYINACFVHGFNQTRKYIASQGPTEEILNDFWKMIWQTKCCKIVMLTNLREEGKVKCEQYWPSHGSQTYGRITVKMKHMEPFSQFVIRTLTVEKDGSPVRNVTQFHFTAWPDRGVPKYASSMVQFLSKVKYFQSHGDGPIVVHCSAGVGRTGTFIALDNVTEQGKTMGYVDVAGVVETMRKQRVSSVQTLEQYIFVYQAVTEALMLSSSAMPAAKFPKAYEELLQTDLKKKKRKISLEFEALKKMSPVAEETQYVSSKLVRNRNKNRYSNVLPIEDYMPSLTKGDGSEDCDYINAVFLPSYKEKKAFIITQTPLESTVEDFWRLIWEHDVRTLIMMNNQKEMTNSEVYWPNDDQTISFGKIFITNDSTTTINKHTVFSLTIKKFVMSRPIRLFQVGGWKSQRSLPESTDVILSLMELVQSWQQQTENQTILVHCMNGVEKSGLFCVISAVIERMKIEQDVAIPQVIEEMRNAREQIIPSVEQFQFCHEAVLAFIHQYDTYSNFTI